MIGSRIKVLLNNKSAQSKEMIDGITGTILKNTRSRYNVTESVAQMELLCHATICGHRAL